MDYKPRNVHENNTNDSSRKNTQYSLLWFFSLRVAFLQNILKFMKIKIFREAKNRFSTSIK